MRHSYLTCLFHNFTKFDGVLVMDELTKRECAGLSTVSKGASKHMAITFETLRFSDSYTLVPGSLDTLFTEHLSSANLIMKSFCN